MTSARPIVEIHDIRCGDHCVQFYRDDSAMVEALFSFLADGFDHGEVSIIVTTRAHRSAVEKRLITCGYDLIAYKAAGQYFAYDAVDTLALLMKDGLPDPVRFRALSTALLKSASRIQAPIRAFGEMVAILWEQGNKTAALQLERLWNDLLKQHRFTLFCAYDKNHFSHDDLQHGLPALCEAHNKILAHSA